MRVWHYTVAVYLPDILRTGKIVCATEYVPKGQRPAAWFSTNPVWEETANKSYLDKKGIRHSGDKESTAELGKGLLRIEVIPEAAPYSWEDFKKKSGAHRKHIRGMEAAARACGAKPSEWRVSFEPVPRSKWVAVELWNWKEQVWEDFMTALERLEKDGRTDNQAGKKGGK